MPIHDWTRVEAGIFHAFNHSWIEEIARALNSAPPNQPLTLAAYECDLCTRAYVVHAAVADVLTSMPLFLEPRQAVEVPLEATYQAAFAAIPRRWRRVLEP